MSKFTIWYVDSVISGETVEDWIASPTEGVIAIHEAFYRKPNGALVGETFTGADWYWMTPDGKIWQSPDSAEEPGVWLEPNAPENAILKKGKWCSDERMSEVISELSQLAESRE